MSIKELNQYCDNKQKTIITHKGKLCGFGGGLNV
jgi:hypothetical protein